MLIRRKHVSFLKTLTGTRYLLISICPGLTGKTINFMGKIEECIPKGVVTPCKNLPWLSKNLISAVRKRINYTKAKQTGNFSKCKLAHNRLVSNLCKERKHTLAT